MTKEEFAKVIEQKARATQETRNIDWAAKRDTWLQDLARFYETVEGFLAQFQQAGQITLRRSKVPITEEHIGGYQADSMTIVLGSEDVTLVPVGTLLIGARGRVDMTGPAGTAKFVLVEKNSNGIRMSFTETNPSQNQPPTPAPAKPGQVQEEYVWKLATPPPKVRFIELDAETFFSTLTGVING